MPISARLATGLGVAMLAIGGSTAQAQATQASAPPSVQRYVCDYTDNEPTLSVGSQGLAVKQAQCQLNSVLDRLVTVDGQFGAATKSATKAFQQCAGLTDDGIIGANTWRELDYWWWNDIDCHK